MSQHVQVMRPSLWHPPSVAGGGIRSAICLSSADRFDTRHGATILKKGGRMFLKPAKHGRCLQSPILAYGSWVRVLQQTILCKKSIFGPSRGGVKKPFCPFVFLLSIFQKIFIFVSFLNFFPCFHFSSLFFLFLILYSFIFLLFLPFSFCFSFFFSRVLKICGGTSGFLGEKCTF